MSGRTPELVGAVVGALGVLALVEALRLKDDWQGARLMPAVVGLGLLALGVAHLRMRAGASGAWPDTRGALRVLAMFLVLALYVGVLPALGFLPATVLLVLAVVRALGDYSWPVTVIASAAIGVASHVVFKHWLGMPLPPGPLGL